MHNFKRIKLLKRHLFHHTRLRQRPSEPVKNSAKTPSQHLLRHFRRIVNNFLLYLSKIIHKFAKIIIFPSTHHYFFSFSMKFPGLTPLLLLVLAGTALCCCSRSGAGQSDGVEISQLDANFSILTAQRIYRFTADGDTGYLDRSVSIHWPAALGDADLAPLRDAILSACFGPDTTATAPDGDLQYDPASPDPAIRRFLLDTSDLAADSLTSITPVDSIPESAEGFEPRVYFSSVKASVLELDEQLITYRITVSSYMGGAHPITAIFPLTYDFTTSTLLTLDNLLNPEARHEIMPIITAALARQLDVPVSHLRRAGIFTDQFTEPGTPYIYNNTLYFHYNPYEIAPYSSGMIDVALYPYEIDSLLTPEARPLLDLDF